MKYFLGIDGGGTKTKVIVINEQLEKMYEKVSGPSSIDTVSIDVTYKHISKALEDFLNTHPDALFKGIFAGLGGIVFEHDKEQVVHHLKKLPGVYDESIVVAQNDMYNALYSGLLFDEGITLICGTGMVAFGKDLNGKTAKCGGWGYKEGEYGSGFHLGMESIRYAIRCYDGRLPMDSFANEVAASIGMKEAADIIELMDELYLDRTKVASLAPFVTKYANLKHAYALKIVELATDELFLAIQGVIYQLNLNEQQLVVVGSLGNVDGVFKERLHQKLKQAFPKLTILAPRVDPAYAAALMAQKQSISSN